MEYSINHSINYVHSLSLFFFPLKYKFLFVHISTF